jgi:hypothetical protein
MHGRILLVEAGGERLRQLRGGPSGHDKQAIAPLHRCYIAE